MKRILILLFAVLLHSMGAAQTQTVVLDHTRGARSSTITTITNIADGEIRVTTSQGTEVHEYVMDSRLATLSWRWTDSASRTSLNTVKTAAGYTISGKLEGAPIAKTFASRGLPWYQNIALNLGREIAGSDSFRFECIRPDNLKLYEMQADRKAIEQIDGANALRVNIHLTGALAKFFGADYWVDSSTGQFIKYKGVQGPPGTPATVISRKFDK